MGHETDTEGNTVNWKYSEKDAFFPNLSALCCTLLVFAHLEISERNFFFQKPRCLGWLSLLYRENSCPLMMRYKLYPWFHAVYSREIRVKRYVLYSLVYTSM